MNPRFHELALRLFRVLLCLCAAILALPGLAAEPPAAPVMPVLANPKEPQLRLPPIARAPVIDGQINEAEWAGGWMMEGSVGSGDQALDERRAWAYIAYNREFLYLAIRSQTRPGGQLYTWAHDPDEAILSQDGVEFWIAALDSPDQPPTDQFQLWYDPQGTQYAMVTRYGAGFKVREELPRASRIIGDEWHFELAFPWKVTGLTPEQIVDGRQILIRPCRNWRGPLIYSSWGGEGAFYGLDNMMRVIFDSTAPVIRVPELGQLFAGQVDLKVSAFLPGAPAAPVSSRLTLTGPAAGQPGGRQVLVHETRVIPLGETHIGEANITHSARFPAPPPLPDNQQQAQRRALHYTLELAVLRGEPAQVIFARTLHLPGRRQQVWSPLAPRQTQLGGGYYPYYGKVLAKLDLGEHPRATEITRAAVSVRLAGADQVLGQGEITRFPYGKGQVIVPVGDLAEGNYEISATLFAGTEAVAVEPAPLSKFTRQKQPWEHNQLGQSTKVYPPFTPLTLTGQTLGCVLREHTLNGLGLWDQVLATGQPLLAEPMRLELRSGGKVTPLRADAKVQVLTQAGHAATLKGQASAPTLTATAESLWEYDGMHKVTLTLTPVGQPQVDELALVIPMHSAQATLLHATTATRSNPSLAMPDGQGVLWDSGSMVQTVGKGTFTPYLWVGGVERGICWFADSDEGWVTDDQQPAIVVERVGKVVNLRVRLINRPGVLSAPRRLVFGLMATPVKPVPAASRAWWPDAAADRNVSTSLSSYRFAGFAKGETLDPLGGDFSVFGYFAKYQGKGRAPKECADELATWMKQYVEDPNKGELHAQLLKTFNATTMSDEAVYYTNPGLESTSSPQGRQFGHEWKGGVSGLGCNFVPSYNDYAAWCYDQMLATGLRCHVYQDNTFPVGSTDLIAGGAYIREDGKLQTGWNIFGHREFYKRLFVVGWERMGRLPLTYPHTTNALTVPQFSFATVHLALEWQQYGTRTFQEKFPFALLRAEVMGRQAGLIPRILCGMGPKSSAGMSPEQLADKDRLTRYLTRTREGVLLLHDSFPRDHGPYLGDLVRRLMPLGWHQDSTEFIGYWDQPRLLTATPGTAVSLYRMGQTTLAVVVDTSGQDAPRTLAVDEAVLGRPVKALRDFEAETVTAYSTVGGPEYRADYAKDGKRPGAKLGYYNLTSDFTVTGRTTATVTLRKHDYLLLLIE